ncbi:YraN family protein [Clostridium sp. LIBA-8841]|uniref:YraN family protein n=1 Tax=Clostridium sp. LIBA-8841 TaxID=2987530 RepID=UPI002AC49F06|nr:YraN family protein [Clostridium sp. LIBA-8841]MDZ5252636.1 YraN family protein [Clostridium sp. LIBA-8841]
MKKYNKSIGSYGEEISVDFLKKDGYSILEKNFNCSSGEIDIIALRNEILSFIEVKSRFTKSFGNPKESVTCHKQRRIIAASKYYLHLKKLYNYYIRFDVIEINFNFDGSEYELNFLKDAFRL